MPFSQQAYNHATAQARAEKDMIERFNEEREGQYIDAGEARKALHDRRAPQRPHGTIPTVTLHLARRLRT